MTSRIKRRSSVYRGGLRAPSLSASPVSDTQIFLSWSNVSGETGYSLERSANGVSGWSVVYTAAANETSRTDSGLTANTIYYYRVRAVNGVINGPYSSVSNATTYVVAPTPGFLPFGDEEPIQENISYRVIFTDTAGSYSGYEGILLNDLSTVLTSAQAASDIGGSISKFRAVMGVSDLTDLSHAQSVICSGAAYFPAWSNDYPDNVGYVTTPGFSPSIYIAGIDYTAAYDSTPYSGEYFYPDGTSVAWASNLDRTGGFSILTNAQGTKGQTISDAALQTLVAGTNGTNIGADFSGAFNQGAPGSGLIVAGYGSYFAAGAFINSEDVFNIAVFSRFSHFVPWIEGETGVSPIVYP